MIFLAGIT